MEGKLFLDEEQKGENLCLYRESEMSLGVKYIIPSKPGFTSIFSEPDLRIKKSNLVILGKKNCCSNPRLGVSIKKKDYSLAVHRNTLKREVKQSFMLAIKKLPSYDYVVIVGRGKFGNSNLLKQQLNIMWDSCNKT